MFEHESAPHQLCTNSDCNDRATLLARERAIQKKAGREQVRSYYCTYVTACHTCVHAQQITTRSIAPGCEQHI